jgi:hypothetical protein
MGLKMVGRDRMIVGATVVFETDDDHALDLSGVGRMLKETLAPLSAEVVELELIGYCDEDEDDAGQEELTVREAFLMPDPQPRQLEEMHREAVLLASELVTAQTSYFANAGSDEARSVYADAAIRANADGSPILGVFVLEHLAAMVRQAVKDDVMKEIDSQGLSRLLTFPMRDIAIGELVDRMAKLHTSDEDDEDDGE